MTRPTRAELTETIAESLLLAQGLDMGTVSMPLSQARQYKMTAAKHIVDDLIEDGLMRVYDPGAAAVPKIEGVRATYVEEPTLPPCPLYEWTKADGWAPVIPEPYVQGWWRRCACGARRWGLRRYREHYAMVHIIEGHPAIPPRSLVTMDTDDQEPMYEETEDTRIVNRRAWPR